MSQYLGEYELELADDTTIRYNPFLSKLSIDSLAIHNKDTKVLALSSLTLEVSAYQLISNKVNVSEFVIDGLYLVVNKQENSLQIAGFTVPNGETGEEKKEEKNSNNINPNGRGGNIESGLSGAAQQSENDQESELALQLIMPKMIITNSTVEMVDAGTSHLLNLNEVDVKVTKITPALQDLSISVLADFNGSDISLSASTEMHDELGDIDFEIDVSKINLYKLNHFFAPHLTVQHGFISYQGKHKLKLLKSGIRLEISDLGFSTQGIEMNKRDVHVTLGEQDFNSPLVTVDLSNDAKLTIAGQGDLIWKDAMVFNKTQNQVLAAISQLELKDLDIHSEGGQYTVSINETSLLDSFFSNDTEDEIPALTLFTELNIKNTELTNEQLIIDSVDLAGLKSNIQLDNEKRIKNLIINIEALSKTIAGDDEVNGTEKITAKNNNEGNKSITIMSQLNSNEEVKEEVKEESDKKAFHLKLNRFNIVDGANIQFSDQSVSPNYSRYVKITELSAGSFDTQQPELTSVITLKGSSNGYSSFDFVALIKPFLEVPEYQVKGGLNQMDLESLTAYVKDALGYEIESGQLDLDVTVELIGTKIKGNSHIVLRGIELSSIENYEKEESSTQSYIPFNTALGMLKDGNGNVELDLPISGDTSSPSFGLSGFVSLLVKRATIAGAKEYLTMTFVPYASLVKIVMAADKHLLKLEISNLNYAPTEVDVTKAQAEFLTTFTSLLKDKTDLQIRLCGVSTAEDIGKEKGGKLTQDDIEALIKISELRANSFKEYMVEEKEISSSRLLLCKPRINNTLQAVPHIQFET